MQNITLGVTLTLKKQRMKKGAQATGYYYVQNVLIPKLKEKYHLP